MMMCFFLVFLHKTSQRIYTFLSQNRQYWMRLLENTNSTSPLACPPLINFRELELEELKRIALKSSKIQSSENGATVLGKLSEIVQESSA